MTTISDALNNPVLWVAAGGWFLRELWLAYKERHKKIDEKISAHDNRMTALVDRFTHEVHALQMTMAGLSVQVQNLAKLGEQMPKIQKDLDALHSKVRALGE